jgi:S1-C subfamily serine protease
LERAPQAYYQTSWPVRDQSGELARAFESLRQIHYTAEYRTWVFAETAGVTGADVSRGGWESRADTSFTQTRSKRGTAAIIARSGNRVQLLTTNHVVQFPARQVDYFESREAVVGDPALTRRVASVSVLTSEQGMLVPHPSRRPFEVLARDERHDLALVGLELYETSDTSRYLPLAMPNGDARRLSWGSFVYVLGFPSGYPMVTRAIVSNPDWDGRGAFITDGLWNEGISGGLILAVRGDTEILEPVGLARAGAAARELRLQPDTLEIPAEARSRGYTGPIFVETVLRIQYGITLPVSMTRVTEFLDRHRAALRSRGWG